MEKDLNRHVFHELGQTPGDDKGQGSLGAAVHGITKNWT